MAAVCDAIGTPGAMRPLLPLMEYAPQDVALSNLGRYPFAETFAFSDGGASGSAPASRGRIVALHGGTRPFFFGSQLCIYTRTVSGTPCYLAVTHAEREAARTAFARIVAAFECIGSIGPRESLREVVARVSTSVSVQEAAATLAAAPEARVLGTGTATQEIASRGGSSLEGTDPVSQELLPPLIAEPWRVSTAAQEGADKASPEDSGTANEQTWKVEINV